MLSSSSNNLTVFSPKFLASRALASLECGLRAVNLYRKPCLPARSHAACIPEAACTGGGRRHTHTLSALALSLLLLSRRYLSLSLHTLSHAGSLSTHEHSKHIRTQNCNGRSKNAISLFTPSPLCFALLAPLHREGGGRWLVGLIFGGGVEGENLGLLRGIPPSPFVPPPPCPLVSIVRAFEARLTRFDIQPPPPPLLSHHI